MILRQRGKGKAMSDVNEINMGGLMSTFKRAWWKIALISLILASGVFFLLLQMTPRFVSESRVLIAPVASYQDPAAGRNTEGLLNIDQASVLSQIQVIQSRDILAQVIDDFGLMEDKKFQKYVSSSVNSGLASLLPASFSQSYESYDHTAQKEITIDALASNLQVLSLSQSRVLGIRYYGPDPVRTAGVANGIANAYINWQRSERVIQSQDDSVRLSHLISDLKKEVEASEAAVAKYRAQKGIFKSSSNNVTLNRQQLTQLNSRIIAARERRAESEIRAKLIREMLNTEGEVINAPENMRSQLIQRLFEQKTRIQRTISELSATLLPSHPRIRQLRAELKGMNLQIRNEMRRIVQSVENDAKIARAREDSLQKSLNNLKDQSAQTDGDEIQLRALEREARTNRDLLNTYLARFRDAEARKDSAIAPAYATIVSKAHVPTQPYFPKIIPFTLLAFTAFFLIGLGFMIMRAVLSESHQDS